MILKEMSTSDYGRIRALFREVFSALPWNEDWSDEKQLDEYLKDLIEVRNSLLFGLYEEELLTGISIGKIRHWCAGTEYFIEELCIRADCQGRGYGREFFTLIEKELHERGVRQIFLMTDRDKPAYGFYKKNGI